VFTGIQQKRILLKQKLTVEAIATADFTAVQQKRILQKLKIPIATVAMGIFSCIII